MGQRAWGVRICANKVVACLGWSTLLPTIRLQDTREFTSAQQIDQLEGLAVAIPWGFESPLPHHSTRLPARLRRAERLAHGEPSIMSNVLSEPLAGRRLVMASRRTCPHHKDDGIVVKRCITSTCCVAQTTVFTWARRQTCRHASRTTTTDAEAATPPRGGRSASFMPRGIVRNREALKRERQIKRWSLQKKEALARGDVGALSGVSRRARVRTGFTWSDWLARPTE